MKAKLDEHGGNLKRAAVALAQLWRSDKAMRNLEALMIVADKEDMLVAVRYTAKSSNRISRFRRDRFRWKLCLCGRKCTV